MWRFLYKMSSPRSFYTIAGRILPWLSLVAIVLFAYGLVGALYLAPADYQQGDAFRIIYIHVPSATLSMTIYSVMTFCAVLSLVWRIKMADIVIKVSAPLGAWFTFLALVTGAIWGKPMWGTWWVWDARLTSELILLFIYLGIIALGAAITDRNASAKASAIMVLVGAVDIPIIHYSVDWWNTLHQGATLRLSGSSSIVPSMLHPLLAMMAAFSFFYAAQVLSRSRSEVLQQNRKSQWVSELIDGTNI